MGIMDLLSQANPAPQLVSQRYQQTPNVTAEALSSFFRNKATPEQKELVSKLPAQVVSDAVSKRDAMQLAQVQPIFGPVSDFSMKKAEDFIKPRVIYGPPKPTQAQLAQAAQSVNVSPSVQPSELQVIPQVKTPVVANQAPMSPPVAPQQAPQISPPQNMTTRTVGLGTPDISPTVPTQASGGAVPPTVVSGAIVRDTATKAGPEAAQAVAQTMDKPVTKEQAVAATDAVDKFLKDNPDGGTLANILDIVGVALSAYGGTQRETMLQQRNKAKMALSQQQALAQQQFELQQALAQQGYGQQEKMAGMGFGQQEKMKEKDVEIAKDVATTEFERQIAIKDKEIEAAKALNDKKRVNDLEDQKTIMALKLKNDLQLIEAQNKAKASGTSGALAAEKYKQ
jgi:hypothetical protein